MKNIVCIKRRENVYLEHKREISLPFLQNAYRIRKRYKTPVSFKLTLSLIEHSWNGIEKYEPLLPPSSILEEPLSYSSGFAKECNLAHATPKSISRNPRQLSFLSFQSWEIPIMSFWRRKKAHQTQAAFASFLFLLSQSLNKSKALTKSCVIV